MVRKYNKMVIFAKWNGKPVTISHKNNSLTVSLENKNSTTVYSFDRSFRLWTAMVDGISYRRGLNGNIVAKWNAGNDVLFRKWLNDLEINQLLEKAHQTIKLICDDFFRSNFQSDFQLSPNLITEFKEISKINPNFYQNDVKKYEDIYKPVGILPPDQYMSVVLQLTEGCSFNTCTFCTFYRDRPFKIKSITEFETHIVDVKNYLSQSLNLRRTIFLGDANALVVPTKKLITLLKIIHKHLEVEKMGGLYAFLDGFSSDKKNMEEYQTLKSLGLKRIYIGLESGNNDLLNFLRKPGKAEDAVSAVHEMKKAGLSVAIIVLLGAGGNKYDQFHIRDTIRIINQMNLDADDIIYFSELIEKEGFDYSKDAYLENLLPLTAEERIRQENQISTGFIFSDKGTPHISRYDIRDFIY